jgi:hypothetical protein
MQRRTAMCAGLIAECESDESDELICDQVIPFLRSLATVGFYRETYQSRLTRLAVKCHVASFEAE